MQFVQLYTQAGNTALVNDSVLAKQAVNDAVREILYECAWNFTESAALPMTGGQSYYSLAALIPLIPLKIHYIKYTPAGAATSAQLLYPVTLEEMLELQAGQAQFAAVGNLSCFAIGGLDSLYLYPGPNTGDTIKIYYTQDFADMTVDSFVPLIIPDFLHYVIVWIAARNLAIITNPASVGEFEPLATAGLMKCKMYENTFRSRRIQSARVGRSGRAPHRFSDQYWTGDY